MSGPDGRGEMLDLAAAVCDGTATDDQRGRLEAVLAENRGLWPEYLRYMHVHASLGDRFRRPVGSPPEVPSAPARRRVLTRRDALVFGTGLAGGVGIGVTLLSREWSKESAFVTEPIRGALLQAAGRVWVGSVRVRNTVTLTPGDEIRVEGGESSAAIGYSDGGTVTLANNSEVTVGENGRRLILKSGTISAGIPAHSTAADPLILETAEVTLTRLSGAVTTIGRVLAAKATEVGVHRGQVTVSRPTGTALGDVKDGQILTVTDGGRPSTRSMPKTPDEFAWDLNRPLPKGWFKGYREETADGPVVRPEKWLDPFHQAEMYQIRSDHQWACPFFRLHPDSTFRVRYWVEEAGPSQLCLCVRQDHLPDADTCMLECNTAFTTAKPREWQMLEVKAKDMLGSNYTAKFPPPWLGFLVIFNTYKVDLGLKIAEFRVTAPGRS